MGEVQRMIDLPSDVMSNISTFLIGSPEDTRIKNTKAFKRIQQQYRLKIEDIEVKVRNRPQERLEIHTITLKNTSLSIPEVLTALTRRLHLLKSRLDYSYNYLSYHIYFSDIDERIGKFRRKGTGEIILKMNNVVFIKKRDLDKSINKSIVETSKGFQSWGTVFIEKVAKIEIVIIKGTHI